MSFTRVARGTSLCRGVAGTGGGSGGSSFGGGVGINFGLTRKVVGGVAIYVEQR
jgi:hypothetical protein